MGEEPAVPRHCGSSGRKERLGASGPAWRTGKRFVTKRLDALKASLGPFPERTPLHAAVTRRLDYGDGFILEESFLKAGPGWW